MQIQKHPESIASENNKRIAKNTLFLYFRMMLTMLVSLITVRIVLKTLGVTDFGIYNVVGGVVAMFSVLSGTMATASQRFFAFELGTNNITQLKKTFSMTMTIYALLALVIFSLAETVGLWFLNTQLTIPATRMEAAKWVYQFSVFSFITTILTIPYNAAIIAHERMKMYAYVSILEVTLKLAIVYLLVLFSFDKLTLYAILIFVINIVVTYVYRTYSKLKFEECEYFFHWDRKLFNELISYSSWNLFGSLAGAFSNQGINIVLNIFFGPVVNAARGIAYQMSNAINQFVSNFMTATNPQIVKYYALGDRKQMLKLVFQSSKLSYLLLFILSMPILIETQFIFNLWLSEVPEYVILFSRLIIIIALIDSLSLPLMAAAQSTGQIMKYQVIVGSALMLNLPVSCLFFNFGFPPQTAMYVAIIISLVCLILRLWMLTGMVGLSIAEYFKKVIASISLITFLSYLIPLFIIYYLPIGIYRFIIVGFIGLIISVLITYKLGLSLQERHFITSILKKTIRKRGTLNIDNKSYDN